MHQPATTVVRVWDPLVRLVHWSMVASVAIALIVTEGRIHDTAGYALLALIAVRILWGIFGPEHARFSNFAAGPRSVFQYVRQIRAGDEPRYIGHNPLGGWMIAVLLTTGIVASLSGWIYTTDAFWGVAWLEQVHIYSAYLLLVLAMLHVAGVVVTSMRQRENLIAAMVHGRKRASDNE